MRRKTNHKIINLDRDKKKNLTAKRKRLTTKRKPHDKKIKTHGKISSIGTYEILLRLNDDLQPGPAEKWIAIWF